MKKYFVFTLVLLFVVFFACRKEAVLIQGDEHQIKNKIEYSVAQQTTKILDHLYEDLQQGDVRKATYDAILSETEENLKQEGIYLNNHTNDLQKNLFRALSKATEQVQEAPDGTFSLDFVKDVVAENIKKYAPDVQSKVDLYYVGAIFESMSRYAMEHPKQMEDMENMVRAAKGDLFFFQAKNGIGWKRFQCRFSHAAEVAGTKTTITTTVIQDGKKIETKVEKGTVPALGFLQGLFDDFDCSRERFS